jgi:hypothetical protein
MADTPKRARGRNSTGKYPHKPTGIRIVVCLFVAAAMCSAPVRAFTPPPARLADPLVEEMLGQVQTNELVALNGSLSGEWPAWVEAAQYTFNTRATASGTPIQKATQYVYELLQAQGLSPAFHEWEYRGYIGRNVIGTIMGNLHPDQIVLLTAHLDDAPWSGRAPGADDNASGCTALLEAADILREYRFDRTVRFVFFTGEEQGMLGSHEYAADMRALNENIVAVLNLDMIAYDSLGNPDVKLHFQTVGNDQYTAELQIAQTFTNMVNTYNLNLTPIISPDSHGASDHASFWGQNYPAILVIEDDEDDFNRYYHSANDRVAQFNLPYFTNIVKAAVGSAASLAEPMAGSTGAHQAQLDKPAALLKGLPAETVTYLLLLTNTGSLTDTFTLDVDANWTTIYPASVGPLAAGDSAEVEISVSIPAGASPGTADIAVLGVISQGSGLQVDGTQLTTLARWRTEFLPIIQQ